MAVSQEVMSILIQLEGKTAFIASAREEQMAIRDYGAATAEAAASSDKLAAANARLTSTGALVKKAMYGIGLGLIGVAVESVKAAIKFEDMGKTVSQQTGLTGGALDGLMNTIVTTASHAPYALNEISDAAVLLKTKFGQTDSQIEHTSGLLVAFAQRAGGSAKDVGTSVLSILQDFREPMNNLQPLMDQLTSVAQATQKPLSDTLGVVEKYGPKLQAMGFGLQETLKLLGVFQESGISTNAMGRGLSSALTQAEKTSKTTGEDIPTIIKRRMQEISDAKSQQEAYSIAMEYFGKQVGPAFGKALYDNAEAFAAVEHAMSKTGSTQKLFEAQQKSVGGQWQELKNQLFKYEVEMGKELIPILKEGITDFIELAKGIMEVTDHGKLLVPIVGSLVGLWIAYKAAMVGVAVWRAVAAAILVVRSSMILLRAELVALAIQERLTALAALSVPTSLAASSAKWAAAGSMLGKAFGIAAILGIGAYVALHMPDIVQKLGNALGLNSTGMHGTEHIKLNQMLGGNQTGESGREGEAFAHLNQAQKEVWYREHHIPGYTGGAAMTLPSTQPPASMATARPHNPDPTTKAEKDNHHYKFDATLVLPNGQVLTSLVTKELEVKRSRL